ncbi:hypothetical protein ACFU6S_30830 [Streptomyces sp. NPDC057456]|uniref:hypothetical protein n=1 Tax=Streptomyces sp. NPDC057456 TaxID=3346139 RepID=UPI00369637DA
MAGPDSAALVNLYKTIQNTVDALDGDFPVNVMEHATWTTRPSTARSKPVGVAATARLPYPRTGFTEGIDDD